ncbi:MAG: acetyl-CoA hydrolase/transferase family protein [Flavobacteriales bacterium]|jgi:succinate CoA transferase|nr:acetyl-CoA hydrolase/transferase family protein [Flavobacteriales bacterium]MBQ1968936.1 acetyl-CoA hydrolase/transferase family protein [Flavobacteriales bacterium]MBQ5814529.1 acetyl-CoA hydrolase/transferase family protein [Flavobacteriales bacterium]MBR4402257.1 acetyl-CoA hydrolase/transferase family protein [Flavobacteriales bacterium]
MSYKIISAEEAASHINHGDNIGFSGFTAAGSPKAVSEALAKRAIAAHEKGEPFQVGVFTGASTSDHLDGALARANAMKFRTPYQSNKDSRAALNRHDVHYYDYHLSQLAQDIRYGFLGNVDVAVIEACDVTEDGEITLTSGVGNTPTFARLAKKIIIELNSYHPKALKGLHDIYEPADPPCRREIPIYTPSDRIGTATVKVDPEKIVGIVETNCSDGVAPFTPLDETTMKIGKNVADFLAKEMKEGRIPSTFLPIQSGVGNIANAVLGCLGENKDIPPFEMYTEVIQDSVVGLMKEGRCKFASGCSLTLSDGAMKELYDDIEFFKDKVVLRPQELSNNPEMVRRMGLITINTAIEADIFGNINSTHIMGKKMMNGIGGSGDFTRNAYISIYTTPSTAKNGCISAFVPMVSHADHSEHSVKIIISEYGVADLRGKSPIQRAEEIIENVVHPEYRPLLREYLSKTKDAHTPICLESALSFHQAFEAEGDMRKAKI